MQLQKLPFRPDQLKNIEKTTFFKKLAAIAGPLLDSKESEEKPKKQNELLNSVLGSSEKIKTYLEKIYEDNKVKVGNIKLTLYEQNLIAQINNLQQKLQQKEVLGIVLYFILRHIEKMRDDLLEIAKKSGIAIPLNKENLHLLFTKKNIIDRRHSDFSNLSDNEDFLDSPRPQRSKSRELNDSKNSENIEPDCGNDIEMFDEESFIIKEPSFLIDKYTNYLKMMNDIYTVLLKQTEIIETVCCHLIKLSGIKPQPIPKKSHVHKTIFYLYVILEPMMNVFF